MRPCDPPGVPGGLGVQGIRLRLPLHSPGVSLPPTSATASRDDGREADDGPIVLTTPPPPPHTSRIFVRPGLLRDVGPMLRPLYGTAKAVVVTDSTVATHHLPALLASLTAADIEPVVCTLPAGEIHKHLGTLVPAYATALGAGIDRRTPVLALGGGVVGDMAGFLAATLLRGLPLVQLPTTLLAMVDASVGGKTGVNLTGELGGKNLIGAFHPADLVLCDPATLSTLPEHAVADGLAECIKHDLLADPDHLPRLVSRLPDVFACDGAVLTELVRHNVQIKASIVRQDPTERGVRAHLNLGHTFAHAFEAVTRHALSHGQAVALGLLAAGYVSVRMGLMPQPQLQLIAGALAAARLPTRCPDALAGRLLDATAVLDAMSRDKKVAAGRLRFVLLAPAGRPVVRDDVPETLVRDALVWLRDGPGRSDTAACGGEAP
ncbi:MAG: 3-dehydroquinate synthase [Tepidisphaerales bacterium]